MEKRIAMKKKKKTNVQETETVPDQIEIEATAQADNTSRKLNQIKDCKGVIGYILRSTATATVDLRDPSKIADYAILSSTVTDMCKQLSELFDLGDTENIAVQGKDIDMLSAIIGDDNISVFTEKEADREQILKKLAAS